MVTSQNVFYRANLDLVPDKKRQVFRIFFRVLRTIILLFMLLNFLWGLGVLFFRKEVNTAAIVTTGGTKDYLSGTFFELLAGYESDLTFKRHYFHLSGEKLYQYHYYGADTVALVWQYSQSLFHVCFVYPLSWITVKLSYLFGWSSEHLYSASNLWIMVSSIFLVSLMIRILVGFNAWKTYKNADKMKILQHKANEIKAKYRNKSDFQSKQQMQFEIMKMYRKMNVSPSGNALNTFLFTPFLFAIFVMVRTTRMIKDSSTETFSLTRTVWDSLKALQWIYLVPVFIYLGLFLFDNFALERIFKPTQKVIIIQNPKDQNKTRNFLFKWVFKIMFFVFFFMVPTGTSIYWIFSSLFEIIQKIIFFYLNKWQKKRQALFKKGVISPWTLKKFFTFSSR